jgi:hypothetical protein
MKKLILLLLLIPLVSFGQYSTYYGTYDVNADVNVNANINKNVNVSGTVNKNITTIDYGALANANAQREANRIEGMKIANEQQRQALIEIAKDPNKAFDYGSDNNWPVKGKTAQFYGFKKFTYYHKIPNQSLFTRTQKSDFSYENVSNDFIKTEIELSIPLKPAGIKDKNGLAEIKRQFDGIFNNVEEFAKMSEIVAGEYNEEIKSFIHKKDINKATIFGINGFKGTLIYEDDYEYAIKDNYWGAINGLIMQAGVRYTGDKDDITFEDLEGRRYYLRKLVEKIISTQNMYDVK